MIDTIIGRYSSLRYSAVDENYQPSDSITGRSLSAENNERLTVLFPPWHGGGFVYDALTRKLHKEGSAVLSYTFHGDILQPDIKTVVESFGHIQKSITDDIEIAKQKYRYDSVDFIASSLGNVSLCLTADSFPDFDKATMVVPGSDLALCAWEGSRTQAIRTQFEAQGLVKADLHEAWSSLAPKSHIDRFIGKQALLHTSVTDTVIPAEYQSEMVDVMQQRVDNVTVHTSRNGHIASIVKFCMSK